MGHSPVRFVNALSAKLATRSRHVSFFFGAGTSRACGLPDISQLQARVIAGLPAESAAAFSQVLEGRNIEEALSRLRSIGSILSGDQTLDGLTAQKAIDLDKEVCSQIIRELDVEKSDLLPVRKFASWVARSQYGAPVEIFTINYDLLLETAFDLHKVLYFDGFSGVIRARFQTDLVEAVAGVDREVLPSFMARLWKLHGSVNWVWAGKDVVRLGREASSDSIAAIYPSHAKYEQSRRFPFVVLQDRFRRSLNHAESICFICGYSFGDQHLNEMIFEAAAKRERSEYVVLSFDPITPALADLASRTPNLQIVGSTEAILGGIRAPWTDPNDSTFPFWTENGFSLTDFRCFSDFLGRVSALDTTDDLATVVAPGPDK